MKKKNMPELQYNRLNNLHQIYHLMQVKECADVPLEVW